MRVEPGGLNDINEVKILICWLLNRIKEPVSLNTLTDGILADGLVNYFDFAIALSDLCTSGHVERFIVDNASQLSVSPLGTDTANLLADSLPVSVKENVYAAVVASQSEGKNYCTVEPEDDCYVVNMRAQNGGKTLFSITTTVSDKIIAERIRLNFLSSPHDVYLSFINLIK